MRWSIARMLSLTAACAIALVLFSRHWATPKPPERHVLYGVYLAFLALATVAPFSSPPIWKRFWITYAVFGWIYLFFVLRLPDPHTDRNIPLWFKTSAVSEVGILCGFLCAVVSLVVPGPVQRPSDSEGAESEIKS